MALRGTNPESHMIEYTLVYADYRGSRALHEAIAPRFARRLSEKRRAPRLELVLEAFPHGRDLPDLYGV